MKRTILIIKPYVWKDIPGYSVLFVNQLDPADTRGSSIAELKQRFGGTHGDPRYPGNLDRDHPLPDGQI